MYWHVLKKKECIWSVLAPIIIPHIPNINVIPASTCLYLLARIAIHTNTCKMYLACIMACIVVCIESVFARFIIQFGHNTNTRYTNTERYASVLNTYLLVLNTCWHVFNTYHHWANIYHNTCHNTCQYIVHVLACIACQYLHVAITDEISVSNHHALTYVSSEVSSTRESNTTTESHIDSHCNERE